nr:hypothetical protein [Tanacetum cinerariifolium]
MNGSMVALYNMQVTISYCRPLSKNEDNQLDVLASPIKFITKLFISGGHSKSKKYLEVMFSTIKTGILPASYWTAASDVAATSAPVNARPPSVNDGQRRQPPTVNAAGYRSTPADHGGDRRSTVELNAVDHRSTVAVNDGSRWRTTVDCRWTTFDHHRTTGQRWLVGRSTSGPGPVWIWSGSSPTRGMPLSAMCAHMSATCAHVASTWQLTWIMGLVASRRHVAASYWTAASDVAATSAPVNARPPSFNDGQRRQPPTINAAGYRSTAADHGGDRLSTVELNAADHRSTVAVNDGRR